MKKQLIVLGFLVCFFSLWGMDQGSTEQHITPNPIKILNNLITSFFDENQNEQTKLEVLDKIRTNFKNDIGISSDIKVFLETKDNDKRFLQVENAYRLFFIIYFIYFQVRNSEFKFFLENYPDKICSIFELCFSDETYLKQPESRVFFLIMLSELFNYIKKKPLDNLKINNCLQAINTVGNYINSIGSSRPTEITFSTSQSLMQSLCQLISSSADEFSPTSLQRALLTRVKSIGDQEFLEMQEAAIPLAEETPVSSQQKEQEGLDTSSLYNAAKKAVALEEKKKTKKGLENPNKVEKEHPLPQENTLPLPMQDIRTEIQSEPAFWDRVVNGWNRFVNMLKLMSGV